LIYLQQNNRPTDTRSKKICEQAFKGLLARSDLGFFQLPERSVGWVKSQQRASEILKLAEHIVFVGIGGSSLGGKTVRSVLRGQFSPQRLSFLENVDLESLDELLRNFTDLSRIHWVFVSKSGSTLETLALANEVNHRLTQKGLSLLKQSTVISEAKVSPLTQWAEQYGIDQLAVDHDVGGRFSVLTPVGLLPAALMGAPIEDMRRGAHWALRQESLVADLGAQVMQSFERQEWITQFWFYADALATFGDWVQQLWAESLAKPTDRSGHRAPRVSSPVRCVGAIDQHSVLQQLMEGERDKHVWLIRVRALESATHTVENMFSNFPYLQNKNLTQILNAEGTAMYQALEQQDISVLQLEWRDLSPETLGAAFMLFQLLIGTLGEALNIDAFNQPGVELGKKLAQKILTAT
jgi:glucose-6-phosphate isomerase